MNLKSTKKLNNGTEIPLFGLGVFLSEDGEETANAVQWALEAGYRHIDTAKIYGNEKSVGEGIRRSGVPREEIFITTKLWNDDMRAGRQKEVFEESLQKLGTDYVDLYLIHWPVENYIDSWKAMEEIYATGKARAVGVSNFHIHHLEDVFSQCKLVPAVNQIECHPALTQEELIAYCEGKGIVCEAYSPLGGQEGDLLTNPVLLKIAKEAGKTPAQIMLRWNLQRNIVVIPKSVHKNRIVSNSELYDFTLSDSQMKEISALNQNRRFGANPDNFDF